MPDEWEDDATADWLAELDDWLTPFLAALGDARRRPWGAAHVEGLVRPGARQSMTPLAAEVATHAGHGPAQRPPPAPTQYHQR